MTEKKDWKHDETIRAWADEFRRQQRLSIAQLTARLGAKFSPTRVGKYLTLNNDGNAPEPDAPAVETALRNLRRHWLRIGKFHAQLFQNRVSAEVAGVLKHIRRTGDFGLIWSEAGYGKTCSGILFCRDHPDTIMITAKHPNVCSDWALMRLFFDDYQQTLPPPLRWNGNEDQWAWLEKSLQGTERLLIVDDAELLFVSALRWLFSLHDATGIPIALFGNMEVLDKLRRVDSSGKMISRIGIVHEVAFGFDPEETDVAGEYEKDLVETAQKLIAQFAPGSNGELVEDVKHTISGFGHGRRARKQLSLAENIYERMRQKNWPRAYALAGDMLLDREKTNRKKQ